MVEWKKHIRSLWSQWCFFLMKKAETVSNKILFCWRHNRLNNWVENVAVRRAGGSYFMYIWYFETKFNNLVREVFFFFQGKVSKFIVFVNDFRFSKTKADSGFCSVVMIQLKTACLPLVLKAIKYCEHIRQCTVDLLSELRQVIPEVTDAEC